MPIKRENRHRYPRNWREIRAAVLDRASQRCEWCGISNGVIGRRRPDGSFDEFNGMEIEAAGLDGIRLTRIVLTIAHLDHTPENCELENLRALCQRCHLEYDKPMHLANSRQTRARRKDEERPLLAAELGGSP